MCTNVNKEDYLMLKAEKRVRDFYYYYYLGLTCVYVGMVLMFNLSVPEDLSRRTCVLGSGRKRLLSCNSSQIDYNQDDSHSYPLPFTPNTNPIPPVQMPLSAQQLLSLTTSVGLNVPPPPCLPIYSTSGFEVMSILARVATCPHTSLPRPFSIYVKRWTRIRNVKRASPITGKAVRRLQISSLSSLSLGALTIRLRRRTKSFITSVFRST